MDKEDARYQKLEQLHETRKQVVRLHRKGHGVMAIAGMTGLSYAWRNGRATDFSGATLEHQNVWGLSVDQRLGDDVTLFGRYGHVASGHPAFDRALTLGAELSGNYWDRAGDSFGLALGWLAAADAYEQANPGVSGSVQLAELYYHWRVNAVRTQPRLPVHSPARRRFQPA